MKIQLRNYSLKLWLTVAIASFTLFQVPLYFMYNSGINNANNSYFTLLWDFTRVWLQMVFLLLIPCFLIYRCIRAFYQPDWSVRGFKVSLVLISVFFMSFSFVIYFFFFNGQYIVPTGYVLLIFLVCFVLGVFGINHKPLIAALHQEHLERE